jgi:hypothetical protein
MLELGTRARARRLAIAAAALALAAWTAAVPAAQARTRHRVIGIGEYRLAEPTLAALRTDWLNQLAARYPVHTWAPMRFDLSNADLRLMGLPSKRVLLAHRYRVPTAVYPNGTMRPLASSSPRRGSRKPSGGSQTTSSPGVITYAGLGAFGIRPGAWLLLLSNNSVGWCSLAHVYGTPGSYQISTAGHCGKPGDTATVIGAVGNHSVGGATVPVLLDFGKFVVSHSSPNDDADIGHDWALLSIYPQYQNLVTPTMAFWGGPIGMYRTVGNLVSVEFHNLNGLPTVSANPNPVLAQQIVHYGHGAGLGAGGTPRSGTAITWTPTYYMFFGAISPGDSGSGANTLTGDSVGANRQAAGIMTHLWVDPLMRQGLGIMLGTRATQVAATLANGQILPYPAPTPAPLP